MRPNSACEAWQRPWTGRGARLAVARSRRGCDARLGHSGIGCENYALPCSRCGRCRHTLE